MPSPYSWGIAVLWTGRRTPNGEQQEGRREGVHKDETANRLQTLALAQVLDHLGSPGSLELKFRVT
jgi:hypothetical protein